MAAPPDMEVVEVLLVKETLSVPSPMLRVPAAVSLMVAESSPVSALMIPSAPLLSVMESLPAPMLMFSKLEKEASSRLPELPVEILRVLAMAPV